MSEREPAAMALLRGPLSQRATSAEFNEWQARDVVAYVDRLLAGAVKELSFDQKSWVNARFKAYYNAGMQTGEHGHYETMFVAMHKAYADFFRPIPPTKGTTP